MIYIREYGVLLPNPEVEMTAELLMDYIDKFDKATDEVFATGEIVEGYNYYFEQLEAFAELYPRYEYAKLLERRYQDILAPFFK